MQRKFEAPQVLRRTVIQNLFYLSPSLVFGRVMAALKSSGDDSPNRENLQSTVMIESNHPTIIALAKQITRDAGGERMAAIQIHDWVRDQIPFGIPPAFYETTATESLDVKTGYCNTKVTLFNALLRASGIPTRMRVMDLSAQVLDALFSPGTPYVDHALTEVFLEGKWIRVDSYVVDKPLADAARKRLRQSVQKAGFGIHLAGSSEWDGRSDNFIQYMDKTDIKDYVKKDHGLFADIADFYRKVPSARNRKTLISGLAIRLGSSSINQQINEIRSEAPSSNRP
jgi:transglutaminase-like putative cysteine protease